MIFFFEYFEKHPYSVFKFNLKIAASYQLLQNNEAVILYI